MKALPPIKVTLSGIIILVRLLQKAKAPSPIEVTPSGTFTFVKFEQPWKAPSPILVTLSGICTLVKLEQPMKAPKPIEVTLFGIFTFVRFSQRAKAPSPIEVTLSGIMMLLRFGNDKMGNTSSMLLAEPIELLVILVIPSGRMTPTTHSGNANPYVSVSIIKFNPSVVLPSDGIVVITSNLLSTFAGPLILIFS